MSMSKGLRHLARSPTRKAVTAAGLIAAGYPSGGSEDPETYARKLSAVDRCIEILSDSMAKLPVYVMDSRTRQRLDHPLLRLLNIRPNEAHSPSVMKKVVETSRLTTGNGYLWICRSPRTGRAEELIPVPGHLVEPWKDPAGRIWYTVTHPFTGEPMVLPREDVCHVKAASRDGLKGISPLKRGADVLAAARAAQEYNLTYYQNGGQPSGVLKTDTDLGGWAEGADGKPLQRADGSLVSLKDQLRGEWEKIHAGPKNGHRVAILDLGLDYKPIAASNQEAQFVENQEITIRDLARLFGVPLHFLGEGKQAYSSNEQQAIEYVTRTLHPIVTQYEEELSYRLLTDGELGRGLEIRFNLLAELKGDNASRADWYRTLREIGVFSANDVRALEDMEDVPGGDTYYASLNYVPLEDFRRLSTTRAETRSSAE